MVTLSQRNQDAAWRCFRQGYRLALQGQRVEADTAFDLGMWLMGLQPA